MTVVSVLRRLRQEDLREFKARMRSTMSQKREERAGHVAQQVEHFPSMHEVLGSIL